MRTWAVLCFVSACAGTCALNEPLFAQSAQPKATPKPAQGAGSTAAPEVTATLAQLMRGILFPASNFVFFAQGSNPADVPEAKDPSAATDLLASSYGKWQAIENSALAIAETANLLSVPGRKCSNGVAVPIGNADWPKLVKGLRDAGLVAYKAAQTKDQDKILEASDVLTVACSNCHDKYREKPNLADRCK
jgi:cytochrome c556